MIQTILVAVDDSGAAFRAAGVAVELAQRLGARLVAVSVADGALADRPWGGRSLAGAEAPLEAQMAAVRAAQKHMHALAERAGVDVELRLVRGHVADALLDQARGTHAGLIVIGRVDRPGVRLTHVGRTAEQVLEFSEIPVLVVPAPRDA
jgi:nucleotide-binding universal stress UspA family protein